MLGLGPTELVIIMLIPSIIIVPLWMILSKAGYNGVFSLVVLIPIVGTILGAVLILFMAFSTWPIEKRLNELENKE